MKTPLWRRCIAEFISTFCLILIGCGAMVVDAQTGALTHVGVATVWGLIVMVMIYAVGPVSGAHMNPAVTIAFASAGRLPLRDCFGLRTHAVRRCHRCGAGDSIGAWN